MDEYNTNAWIIIYVTDCLFTLWILRWGGARWCEGFFKGMFFISIFAAYWNAEQIKLYILTIWVFTSIWFVVGLMKPELRIIV